MSKLKQKAEELEATIIWSDALVGAGLQGGELGISWKPQLGKFGINPMIFAQNIEAAFEEKRKASIKYAYDGTEIEGASSKGSAVQPTVIKTIRLVGTAFTSLPDTFGINEFPKLDTLSLANNSLTYIPDSLCSLTSLRDLNLQYNSVKELPERLGMLCSLQRIQLANNSLERLPATFGALEFLTRIDLEKNNIKVLPENLDLLLCCTSFNVNNNKLIRIPKCVNKMPSLTSFSAQSNQLTYITQEIFESISLKIIRLSCNQITRIPEKIGDMAQLQEICLDYNKLESLPISMYKSLALKILRVEGNEKLFDPTPETIAKGARAVVSYLKEVYLADQLAEMRKIIRATQGVLQMVERRKLGDPALFQANVHLDDNDPGK